MKNIFNDLFKKKNKVDNSLEPISTTPSNNPKKKKIFLIKLNLNFNL